MSNERTLEMIVKDIEQAELTASKDLDLLPLSLRAAHGMAKRQAADLLPELKAEYRMRLFSSSLLLVLTGGTKEREAKFIEVAAQEGGTFAFDAEELYVGMARALDPSLGRSREFLVDHVGMLNNSVSMAVRQLEYRPPVTITMRDALKCVPTFEDLVSHIRYVLTAESGHGLNLTYMGQKLVAAALEARFGGRVFVAVATNVRPEELQVLNGVFSRSSNVDLSGDTEIDEAFAINAFKQTKSKRTKSDPIQTKTNE